MAPPDGPDLPPLALSVRQPWAWAIVHGGKDIENRTRGAIRAGGMGPGRVCIHAALGMARREYDWGAWRLERHGVVAPRPDELIRGALIGAVEVMGIVDDSPSPWFGGPCGLVLRDPRPIDPVPAPGALGYFAWRGTGDLAAPVPWMLAWHRPSGDSRTSSLFGEIDTSRAGPPPRPWPGTRVRRLGRQGSGTSRPRGRSRDEEAGQAMIPTERFELVEVASAGALHEWLAANFAQAESVWLVRWLKHAGARSVPIDAILDELLCWGWVDGLARKLDAERTLRLASPRRHQRWTRTYKERAARLIEGGRMQPPGLAAIEEARRTGAWDELDHVDDLLEPSDLAAALDAMLVAREWWDASAPSYRRNVLRWLALAKTPATRGKRIAQMAQLSARSEKVPQM